MKKKNLLRIFSQKIYRTMMFFPFVLVWTLTTVQLSMNILTEQPLNEKIIYANLITGTILIILTIIILWIDKLNGKI